VTKSIERYRYLLNIFVYALRNQEVVYLYTLYRCAFIYRVITDFLELNEDDAHENWDINRLNISNDLSIVDQSDLNEALIYLVNDGFIERNGSKIVINSLRINTYIENIHSDIVATDLNRVGNFVNIVFSYPDDVVLSMFIRDPNIEYAKKRNIDFVNLDNNRLSALLMKFRIKAKDEFDKDLDNYDVFVSWMNFVQSEYIRGKNTDEQ